MSKKSKKIRVTPVDPAQRDRWEDEVHDLTGRLWKLAREAQYHNETLAKYWKGALNTRIELQELTRRFHNLTMNMERGFPELTWQGLERLPKDCIPRRKEESRSWWDWKTSMQLVVSFVNRRLDWIPPKPPPDAYGYDDLAVLDFNRHRLTGRMRGHKFWGDTPDGGSPGPSRPDPTVVDQVEDAS